MMLAQDTADSATVVRHGQWVVKRIDPAAWEARWRMDVDEQMTARATESQRWPLVVRHFWFPGQSAVVRRFVEGRIATISECEATLRMCAAQGRLSYLRDVRRWNLIVDRRGRVWLIDFWIDPTEWVA